jgi:hypothetical protein
MKMEQARHGLIHVPWCMAIHAPPFLELAAPSMTTHAICDVEFTTHEPLQAMQAAG